MTDHLIEVKRSFSEEEIRQICEVEVLVFSKKMQESPEDLREMIEDPRGIHVVLKNRIGKVIGYISSLPHNEALAYLESYDQNLRQDPSALYIESVAVVAPREQLLGSYSKLFKQLLIEARKAGYKKVTMHVRKDFVPILEKYGGVTKYTVQNWYDFGEEFNFMEYQIPEEGDVLKR